MTKMETQRRKRRESARQGAERTGYSERQIRRLVSLPRDEWLAEMAAEREKIRAYHDDEGNSWPETAKHFRLSVDTVKRRAYRARSERAQEEADRIQPGLFEMGALEKVAV